MELTGLPIIILAYNRPHYLKLVLESIRNQKSANIENRPIVMFQDGPRDDGDSVLIESNKSVFNEIFPDGTLITSSTNLGIGRSFDRAERYAFETLDAPGAFFFEDDLLLSPVYMQVLEKLMERALSDERIGYVAAFGQSSKPREEQTRLARELCSLHLLWGFGLTKRHWLKCRPYVQQYLGLISSCDYLKRDHEKIRSLTVSWGVKPGDTAQDRIKSYATALVGAVKINTKASYAQYIGESGTTFTPEMFANWGFGKSECFSEIQTLDFDFNSISYDPWHESTNVWRLTGKATFGDLAGRIFGSNPYEGFKPTIEKPDLDNWNSQHPALTRLVMERKPKVIVDLGVWKGMSTITLARAQEKACPNGYVLAIDTFLGSPEHWNRARADVMASLKFLHGMPHIYETFLSNMMLSGVADRVLPIAQTSENAANILRRLGVTPDFVHLDAAHEYKAALRDIRMYYDLLAAGGVLIGDDFNWPSVARAVVHFTDEMRMAFSVEHPKWIVTKPGS